MGFYRILDNVARKVFQRNSVSRRLYGVEAFNLIHLKRGTHYCQIPTVPYW